MRDLKRILILPAVLATAGVTTNCWAQSPNAGATLQEVIVTAQKVRQRDIDVPVAVTEIQAPALASQDLVQLTDYYSRIPGLQVGDSPTNANGISALSLRGVTAGEDGNPTVAVMIDDIPFGATTANGQPPFPDLDPGILQSIEVLRGPQGTLYGASSLGGLIDLISKAPDLDAYTGDLDLGPSFVNGGNTGWSGRGSLNVPLIEDRAALMVSGVYRTDPEWIDNESNGARNVNQVITRGGTAKLLVKPAEDLSITLGAIAQHQTTQNSAQLLVCPQCATNPSATVTFVPLYGQNTIDLTPSNTFNTFEVYSAKIEYNLGWAQLTSISGWNHTQWLNNGDITSVFGFLLPLYHLPGGSVIIGNENQSSRFTQEIRLGASGTHVDWLVGFYFNHETENVLQTLNVVSATGTPSGEPYDGAGPFYYFERAAYADLTYHFTPKFALQVGGRYSSLDDSYSSVTTSSGAGVLIFGPSTTLPKTTSSAHPATWLVSPSYHINRNLMTYFRAATGYRPGGPNVGAAGIPRSYGSDKVTSYELGLKGYTLQNDALKFDAALFDIEWKNIQLLDTDPISELTYFTNGSAARSRGLELSASWNPWRGLTISPDFTYTDARLTQTLPPPTTVVTPLAGTAGDKLPFTAEYAGNLSVQQNFSVSADVSAYVGVDYSYVGSRPAAFLTNSPLALGPRFNFPGYGLLELDAGVDWSESWRLNFYARNLGNVQGVVSATNRGGTAQPSAYFTQPRTIGFDVQYNFKHL